MRNGVGILLLIREGHLGGFHGVGGCHGDVKAGADLDAFADLEGLSVNNAEGCSARDGYHCVVRAAQAYGYGHAVVESSFFALERHVDGGLRSRDQDNALRTGVEGGAAVLNDRCGAVVLVGDGLAAREGGTEVDCDILVGGCADAAYDRVAYISVVIGTRKGVAGRCVVGGNKTMIARADRNMIVAELTDLLPVSKHVGVDAVPVHVATQRMSAAAVAVE